MMWTPAQLRMISCESLSCSNGMLVIHTDCTAGTVMIIWMRHWPVPWLDNISIGKLSAACVAHWHTRLSTAGPRWAAGRYCI